MSDINVIDEALAPYKERKVSEYYISSGPYITGIGQQVFFPIKEIKKNRQPRRVAPKEQIEKLSPDNLDSREFWKKAVDLFPLYTICGAPSTDPNDVNKNTFSLHTPALKMIIDKLDAPEKVNFLEIGPGYGNVGLYLAQYNPNVNYHALDVNPLFEHPNMFHGDGRNIPAEVPKMDFIYSVNVFQHLSQAQRDSYYQQAFDRLESGGSFVVGTFCRTKKNDKYFGWCDEEGNFYAFFLGQLTIVEQFHKWKKKMKKIGFIIEDTYEAHNYVYLHLKKP